MEEVDGVGGAGGDGGWSAALFRLWEEREGRRKFLRLEIETGEMGELPLFPLLIKREGTDVPSFRIKKPPTISPTTLHSTRAVRGGRGGYGVRYGVTQARVPVPCFGPGPTALAAMCGPGPGAPVGVLE